MNMLNIIEEIQKTDADIMERLNPRRKMLRSLTGFGGKIALSALPLTLGSMFRKAYGQGTSTGKVTEVLQFALTLEYLEAEFYTTGLNANTLTIPSETARAALATIRDHENAHVEFLKAAISSLNATPVSKPAFDFTAGGTFAEVFSDYDTFLAVAQAFEDTGVRAYKGQAGNLLGSNDVLTAALNIHSVEARHAAHIRQMRKARGADLKPWITGKESGIGAVVQPVYDGEETDTQAGVKITGIAGMNISASAATESFDEPLTGDQVLAIVTPFLKS